MKKLWMAFLMLLSVVVCFCSCGPVKYEDTNGAEDYSLQTITEYDVINGNSSSSVLSQKTNINNSCKLKIKTFDGVKELDRFGKGTYTLDVSFMLTKGNAGLFLCTDDSILHEFAVNEEGQTYTFENTDGRVYLKVAGEDCGFELNYTYTKA